MIAEKRKDLFSFLAPQDSFIMPQAGPEQLKNFQPFRTKGVVPD